MKHWSIGRRLRVGFGSVAGVAMLVGAIAWWAASALNTRVDQLAAVSGYALEQAADVRFLVADLKARERLVVIAAAKQDKTVMTAEVQAIKEDYARLRLSADELQAASFDTRVTQSARGIDEAMKSWFDQWAKTEKFAAGLAALDAAESTDAGRQYSDQAAEHARRIQATVSERFAQDRVSAASIYTGVRWAIGLSLLMCLILSVVVGYSIRHISETLSRSTLQLRQGSEHVLEAAAQVAASAQTLSRGVLQEAAALEETSASMEEISSMTRQNAEHSQDASRLVAEAEKAVANANMVLGEMVTSMSNIKESSHKVSHIIKTIDEIAFQTNILALNAAVEAARAGAAGMGFAVVADEVRSLAQRSAHAAKDTAVLIEESIARSDRGAIRVERVGASIQEITNSVTKVKTLIDQVSEASRQQAHGFEQVSQALSQMEQMTQNNAASAEASATAGDRLNIQAQETLAIVEQLDALVGRSDAFGAATAPSVESEVPRPAALRRAA